MKDTGIKTMDIRRRPIAKPAQPPAAAPPPTLNKSAAALHNHGSAHTIDLRVPKLEPEPSGAVVHHEKPRVTAPPARKERHLAEFTDRFDRAKQYGKSAQISRFGPDAEHAQDKFGAPTLSALLHPAESAKPAAPAPAPVHHAALEQSMPQMPHLAITHHEALSKMAPTPPPAAAATSPTFSSPRFALSPNAGRIAATATAIVIMAGYIWVQNFPKLALQSADSRAGIAASLPGYVPSSYNLSQTVTAPGTVTLNFTSPSSPSLTITQKQSNWDPSSLLDNYIAKNTDDFSTINGEGLTIYLFGQNQATWVNRGIWFNISGATQLSKDDLLKIAYSL
jgi:Domain of unknown function (DUF4367)